MHFRLDFVIEANTMNPAQTDLGPYCNIGYLRYAEAKVMTGRVTVWVLLVLKISVGADQQLAL